MDRARPRLLVLPAFAALLAWATMRWGWRPALPLAGGWPGALTPQPLLRHKTAKPAFLAVFRVTVAANVVAHLLWHAGMIGAWDR